LNPAYIYDINALSEPHIKRSERSCNEDILVLRGRARCTAVVVVIALVHLKTPLQALFCGLRHRNYG